VAGQPRCDGIGVGLLRPLTLGRSGSKHLTQERGYVAEFAKQVSRVLFECQCRSMCKSGITIGRSPCGNKSLVRYMSWRTCSIVVRCCSICREFSHGESN
jgi:hypothetical protein